MGARRCLGLGRRGPRSHILDGRKVTKITLRATDSTTSPSAHRRTANTHPPPLRTLRALGRTRAPNPTPLECAESAPPLFPPPRVLARTPAVPPCPPTSNPPSSSQSGVAQDEHQVPCVCAPSRSACSRRQGLHATVATPTRPGRRARPLARHEVVRAVRVYLAWRGAFLLSRAAYIYRKINWTPGLAGEEAVRTASTSHAALSSDAPRTYGVRPRPQNVPRRQH